MGEIGELKLKQSMKIEFNFNDLDIFLIGIQLAYGEDENGSFHMLDIGFLLFSITIYKYNYGNIK